MNSFHHLDLTAIPLFQSFMENLPHLHRSEVNGFNSIKYLYVESTLDSKILQLLHAHGRQCNKSTFLIATLGEVKQKLMTLQHILIHRIF